jgi:polyphenol oxidase
MRYDSTCDSIGPIPVRAADALTARPAAAGWQPAEWHAPAGVHAGTSTRRGGVSRAPFASFNLAAHVGDQPAAIAANRAALKTMLALPAEPLWLRQVHGVTVAHHDGRSTEPEADAAVAFGPGRVLAVLTADCLPVVFASRDGERIGIAHAGWRGLAAGVLEATIAALGVPGADLCAWLGPAIGPPAFEVGEDVRTRFIAADRAAEAAFVANSRGRWQADIYALARLRLAAAGVEAVAGGGECTSSDPGRYYSFRREPVTGRMATLVWVEP